MHADVGKLGFGSSATVAALTAWALELCRGADPGAVSTGDVLLPALDGHTHAQGGRGSGADVAVAALSLRSTAAPHRGTLVAFRMADDSRPLLAEQVARSPAAHLLAVWTGVPADTRVLMERVSAFASADPRGHRQAMSDLATVADLGLSSWKAGDLDGVLRAVGDGFEALERLGDLARCPVVIDQHRVIAEVVRSASSDAAAKPSGAGGGDMALVVCAPRAVNEVRRALDEGGYLVVDLGPVGPSGHGS
jgi:phosphomevalonate kinase